MKKFFVIFFGFFVSVSVAVAATDIFTIEMRITEDTTPPSVPANVAVVPVTTTQIDISWDAATDNDILGGYKIFRDAIQIATTTLLNYSDTGLSESTNYSYYIKAFDVSRNISSSSVLVSTTTLATISTSTPDITSNPNTGSQTLFTNLSEFAVAVSMSDVVFTFSGTNYISYSLRWGRTTSYELGFVESGFHRKDQSTRITDLEPGQTYYYQLNIIDRYGRVIESIEDTFATTPSPQETFVPNVNNFTAVVEDGVVYLKWEMPALETVTVRLVRNPRFYPQHDADGYIIYEGKDTLAVDTPVNFDLDRIYYSLFVVDEFGNRSSGAVTSVLLRDNVQAEEPSAVEEMVSLPTFSFYQENVEYPYQGDVVELFSDKPFEISLPISGLDNPYIIFTLEGDMYKGSYFMRQDYEQKLYTAIVPSLIAGKYDIYIRFFDLRGNQYKVVQGTMRILTSDSGTALVFSKFFTFDLIILIVPFFFFVILIIRSLRHSYADN